MSVELGSGGRAFGDHDEDSREAAAGCLPPLGS